MRPRLETASGSVEGIVEAGLCVFRGVPYARPPQGPLRWRPPQPPIPWPGQRDAGRFGPAAPQNGSVLLQMQGLTRLEQSEDCLYLNVWTPALDGKRRPILVWVHGGGFRSGTGSEPIYDPSVLVLENDVVVVTLNYRLGAFGFLALDSVTGDPEDCPNCGLLDQIEALRWVREHADRIGGDRDRVTVFGQSAGAMSLGTLLAVPSARDLLSGAVLQSGAADNVSSPEIAARVAETFLKELGLAAERAGELRTLPLDALLSAQRRTIELSARYVSLTFQPHVDGRVVPRHPLEAVELGEARSLPLLVGTNLDEWNLFGVTDPKSRTLDEERLQRRIARVASGREGGGSLSVERVRALYRGHSLGRVDGWTPQQLWYAIESDRFFHLPALRLAELQSAAQPRTYRYLFTWPSPAAGGALGACHGVEIPFVFGSQANPLVARLAGEGESALRLGRIVRRAWASFARCGDPSHEELGAWPAYDPDTRWSMMLGESCRPESRLLEERIRFWA